MKTYQKVATLVLRLVGFFLALTGVGGLGYGALLFVFGSGSPPCPGGLSPGERALGSVAWLVVGIASLIVARPVGRLLARTLDE